MRYATYEAPKRHTVAMTLSTGVDFVDDFAMLLLVVVLERSNVTFFNTMRLCHRRRDVHLRKQLYDFDSCETTKSDTSPIKSSIVAVVCNKRMCDGLLDLSWRIQDRTVGGRTRLVTSHEDTLCRICIHQLHSGTRYSYHICHTWYCERVQPRAPSMIEESNGSGILNSTMLRFRCT